MTKTKSERREEAAEIVAAAIYNARPYPRSWGEHRDVTGGVLHEYFMKEGRLVVDRVLRIVGSSYPFSEEDCPNHVASPDDSKVCGRCGIHIDSLRP